MQEASIKWRRGAYVTMSIPCFSVSHAVHASVTHSRGHSVVLANILFVYISRINP